MAPWEPSAPESAGGPLKSTEPRPRTVLGPAAAGVAFALAPSATSRSELQVLLAAGEGTGDGVAFARAWRARLLALVAGALGLGAVGACAGSPSVLAASSRDCFRFGCAAFCFRRLRPVRGAGSGSGCGWGGVGSGSGEIAMATGAGSATACLRRFLGAAAAAAVGAGAAAEALVAATSERRFLFAFGGGSGGGDASSPEAGTAAAAFGAGEGETRATAGGSCGASVFLRLLELFLGSSAAFAAFSSASACAALLRPTLAARVASALRFDLSRRNSSTLLGSLRAEAAAPAPGAVAAGSVEAAEAPAEEAAAPAAAEEASAPAAPRGIWRFLPNLDRNSAIRDSMVA